MAYEKISDSIDSTLGIIKFSYASDDLFDSVSKITMYKARNIKNEKGESQIDYFGVSDAERDVFNEHLKTAANDVFKTVLKMSKGVSHAIIINTSGNIEIGIRDNQAYNENLLDHVDVLIEESMITKVVSEWYKTISNDQEYQKYENDFINKKKALYDALFELRKPLIS